MLESERLKSDKGLTGKENKCVRWVTTETHGNESELSINVQLNKDYGKKLLN